MHIVVYGDRATYNLLCDLCNIRKYYSNSFSMETSSLGPGGLCGQTEDMVTPLSNSSNMAAVQEDQNALYCVLTVKCSLYSTTEYIITMEVKRF